MIIHAPIVATIIVAAAIGLPDDHWRRGYHHGRLIANHRATVINGRRAGRRRIADDLRRAIDDRWRSWRDHHWAGVRETRPDGDVH